MAFGYPAALELAGRRCVVIGASQMAEEKARGLLDAGAEVVVIGPSPTPGLREMDRRRDLTLLPRHYQQGDLEGAFLAVSAGGDRALNEAVFQEAEALKVLLNCVDDPAHCHFAAPASLRRGDLTVAVSTGGKAPALAKRLRQELEAVIGPEYGVVVELAGQVRAENPRTVDFETWAARWASAFDAGTLDLVRAGKLSEAEQRIRAAVAGSGPGDPAAGPPAGPAGKVFITGAGPGDPGLMTLRARQAIARADVVVYDRLVDPSLVQGKESVFVGKSPGGDAAAQDDINALLVRLARAGKVVVRLKGGDPFIFGRGGEEIEALAGAGIDFEVIPGASSATAAPELAGIPLTHRGVSSCVAIVTGHRAAASVDWARLGAAVDTIVVLMGLSSLEEIVSGLVAGGMDPSTPAAVVEKASLPSQRVVTESLGKLAAAVRRAEVGGPATLVVGQVVALRDRIIRLQAAGVKDLSRS